MTNNSAVVTAAPADVTLTFNPASETFAEFADSVIREIQVESPYPIRFFRGTPDALHCYAASRGWHHHLASFPRDVPLVVTVIDNGSDPVTVRCQYGSRRSPHEIWGLPVPNEAWDMSGRTKVFTAAELDVLARSEERAARFPTSVDEDEVPSRCVRHGDVTYTVLLTEAAAHAEIDGRRVGSLLWTSDGSVEAVEVLHTHRRRGIASRLWDEVAEAGVHLEHSDERTTSGAAWAAAVGGPGTRKKFRTIPEMDSILVS